MKTNPWKISVFLVIVVTAALFSAFFLDRNTALAAAPAFVQGEASKLWSADPLSVTFGGNVTAGNLIAVGIFWAGNSITLNNVTALLCLTMGFLLFIC